MSTKEQRADQWTREQRAKQYREGIVPSIAPEMRAKIDVQRRAIYETLGMKLPEDLLSPSEPVLSEEDTWSKEEAAKIDF